MEVLDCCDSREAFTMICQTKKEWKTMGKSLQRKDLGPIWLSFDVLPASFRILHSLTLTYTSGFHQSEENTLIWMKTGSWKGSELPRGFLADSSHWPPISKAVWGPAAIGSSNRALVRSGEICELLVNAKSKGELDLGVERRVPIGNSDVTIKRATVHSGVPHLTAEAWNRILFEIWKKEHVGLNFRKCPHDEIWEMANVHNKW